MNVKSMARSAIVMVLSLVLAACQTMGGGGSAAPDGLDPRLANNHSAEFFSKSGLQACGVGALGGLLACQLANPSNKGRCMLIAAAAGCGVGMGANYYIDHQRAGAVLGKPEFGPGVDLLPPGSHLRAEGIDCGRDRVQRDSAVCPAVSPP